MKNTQGAAAGFSGEIIRIADEVLADGTVERIMREKITKGFEDAIESSFGYGELKRAIEARVREILVPYVNSYDMGRYIAKLDEMLGQIVEQTALVDNKRLLENFRSLMVEPPERVMTLEKLFARYCKYVADRVDVSGLEVVFDGPPRYESVQASAEIIRVESGFTRLYDYAVLHLGMEGAGEDEAERFAFALRLSRWKGNDGDGWDIGYDAPPSIPALSRMGDFEVYLSTLSRACVQLVWDSERLDEDVEPTAEPEPDWS